MKMSIRQGSFQKALEKGAAAALSEEAQSDTSNLSLVMRSVKIEVGKSLVVSSTTNLIATKYEVDATDEEGVVAVQDPGSILVPAKELVEWVKRQGEEAVINLNLTELAKPEVISTITIDDDDDGEFVTRKIGTVKLRVKNSKTTQGKWELDCYDPSHEKPVNFKDSGVGCFTLNAKAFGEALGKIGFAALPKDYDHVLDSVSMQVYKKNLYFAATDTKRCAVYRFADSEIEKIEDGCAPMLVPLTLVGQAAKICDPEANMAVSYNGDLQRVFIKQKDLSVRVATAEKSLVSKFPAIQLLLDKDYKILTELAKSQLGIALSTISLVNDSSALFAFKKDQNTIELKAISEDGTHKPAVYQTKGTKSSRDVREVWGVRHLLEALKVIQSDDVQLFVPDNLKSVKLVAKDNEEFLYFAMVIDNPKYKTKDN